MKAVRILHLISTLDIGGAEQDLLKLVTSADPAHFTHEVVSMTTLGPIGERLQAAGIPTHALNMIKGLPDPRGIPRLYRIARTLRPDLIHTWLYHANLLGLSIRGLSRGLIWGILCSDMDLSHYGTTYRWTVTAGRYLACLPSAIVVNSEAGREIHAHMGYKPRKWHLIPNGFDTQMFRPSRAMRRDMRSGLAIPHDAIAIGLIARFDPMKDHACFMSAAAALQRTHPEVHFILAGRGVTADNEALRPHLNRLPLPGQMHLLGERPDIPAVLSALDIASSCSISEGLPNAVGEAMATGLPCVITDTGDSAVLVGDAGIVIPVRDPQALCTAWSRLIEAGARTRRRMGARARKRIVRDYSLQAMVNRYEALYTQTLSAYNEYRGI